MLWNHTYKGPAVCHWNEIRKVSNFTELIIWKSVVNKSIYAFLAVFLTLKHFRTGLVPVLIFPLLLQITRGQNNPSLAVIRHTAEAHVQHQQFTDAALEYEKILYLQEIVLGSDHPDIVNTLVRLGEIYMITGEL